MSHFGNTPRPAKILHQEYHRRFDRRHQNLQTLRSLMNQLGLGINLFYRSAQLFVFFTPLIIGGILMIAMQASQTVRLRYYRLVTKTLRLAGPCFIKLGQWGSTRPDILPNLLCQELANSLHSNAPTHDHSWNCKIIEMAFGPSEKSSQTAVSMLDSIFESFDPNPIGSGSVAQVHRALLRDGTLVAVKILHPSVEEQITGDLNLITFAANLCDSLFPSIFGWLALPEEARHFRQMMMMQLDLRFEAYTLGRFSRNFASSKDGIIFPRPIPGLSSRNVLVETLEPGLPIRYFTQTDIESQVKLENIPIWHSIRRNLAMTGLKSFLQMVLWDNFVHADLHPGNLLVHLPPSLSSRDPCQINPNEICELFAHEQPRLVFLDTGLVTELAWRHYRDFADLFVTLVVHADGYAAGRLLIDRGPERYRPMIIDPDGFCRAIQKLAEPIFDIRNRAAVMSLGKFSISTILLKVFDLVREHHVRLDPAHANLVMSMVCIEGLGRELEPDLNILPSMIQAGLQYLATSVVHTVSEKVEPFL